jgi:hypothetical protein
MKYTTCLTAFGVVSRIKVCYMKFDVGYAITAVMQCNAGSNQRQFNKEQPRITRNLPPSKEIDS